VTSKTETVDGGLGGPPERTREEVAHENPNGIVADGNQVQVTDVFGSKGYYDILGLVLLQGHAWVDWRGRVSIRFPFRLPLQKLLLLNFTPFPSPLPCLTAVPIATTQEQALQILATINMKDRGFMVPLQEAETTLLLPGKACSLFYRSPPGTLPFTHHCNSVR